MSAEMEMETVYTVRCPLGEQCSKKRRVLAKKSSDEDAREAVAWHLQASPYHEVSKEEAENMAALVDVEVTEEEKAAVEEQKKDEGPKSSGSEHPHAFTIGDRVRVRGLTRLSRGGHSEERDDFNGMFGIIVKTLPSPFRMEIRILSPPYHGRHLGFLEEHNVSLVVDSAEG
jgi:hypothetical protein